MGIALVGSFGAFQGFIVTKVKKILGMDFALLTDAGDTFVTEENDFFVVEEFNNAD